MEELKATETDLYQALELLETYYLIERDDMGWYKITISGIDKYEGALPPSAVSKRVEQRKIVLQALHDIYKITPLKLIDNNELSSKCGIDDFTELWGIVYYLERKGLVELEVFLGKNFNVRLTASGYQSFQENVYDKSLEMVGAYRILFQLENRLRKFVERKLRDKYGPEWWEKGISQSVRNKVDQRKKEEASIGWQVSETGSNLEYLLFEHLETIITNNWNEVFQPIFGDQHRISLKLKELETLRHAIAHTRTLSRDGFTRLEQYSSDIETLTG